MAHLHRVDETAPQITLEIHILTLNKSTPSRQLSASAVKQTVPRGKLQSSLSCQGDSSRAEHGGIVSNAAAGEERNGGGWQHGVLR